MPKAPLQQVATLGIDIGKNSFHLIGLDADASALSVEDDNSRIRSTSERSASA
jgi:hypothetical protein